MSTVPVISMAKDHYNPQHLTPVLRLDHDDPPDALLEPLEKAKCWPRSSEKTSQLAEDLRHQQTWLEWASNREEHEVASVGFEVESRSPNGAKTVAFRDTPRALHSGLSRPSGNDPQGSTA